MPPFTPLACGWGGEGGGGACIEASHESRSPPHLAISLDLLSWPTPSLVLLADLFPCSCCGARALVCTRYEFEGDKEDVLANLYQFNLATQIYSCLLENVTSEQASKMTAMDSATTNANDLISKLTIVYNRQRQAKVTTELTEIVAGAESV